MAFEWLNRFQHDIEKPPDYAEKTLAAYRLGMKARGAIAGVVIEPAADCCQAVRELPQGKIYDPKDAPRVPLPRCSRGARCACVYRPVMTYQESGAPNPEHTSNRE